MLISGTFTYEDMEPPKADYSLVLNNENLNLKSLLRNMYFA
jgi:hypothetical protein